MNLFGVIEVTHAFVPLLRRSAPSRIVNMSTPLGSLSLLSDPEKGFAQRAMLAYSTSKTALNSATVVYAERGVARRWSACQRRLARFRRDRLEPHRGARSVEEGAEPVQLLFSDPTGQQDSSSRWQTTAQGGLFPVGVFVVTRACQRGVA